MELLAFKKRKRTSFYIGRLVKYLDILKKEDGEITVTVFNDGKKITTAVLEKTDEVIKIGKVINNFTIEYKTKKEDIPFAVEIR